MNDLQVNQLQAIDSREVAAMAEYCEIHFCNDENINMKGLSSFKGTVKEFREWLAINRFLLEDR